LRAGKDTVDAQRAKAAAVSVGQVLGDELREVRATLEEESGVTETRLSSEVKR
jgi:hypothetical protein